MSVRTVKCLNPQGFHRMAYREWGDPDNPRVVICVHGLARNGRDFDQLAEALSEDYRVVCPDIVGRGESDWLPPGQLYALPQYLSDISCLLARLDVEQVDWVGTSMGGIIGMLLAGMPQTPIRRLVLNDIGAYIPQSSLERIATYLGEKQFPTLEEARSFMQQTYPALRNLTASQWDHIARHGVRARPEGGYALHYDPALALSTAAMSTHPVDLWDSWRAVKCPQMLIWGERSDVLQRDTVEQMREENPAMTLYAVADMEHAPSLMEAEQIESVCRWLC
ncbi:alpha/beta fold hydrolase [Marinobacterium jannaschii]|uniref:alpha/beta fold hydrolase n=1 Tax=Marinobacterium jannaschii TaxID=64970 RepID=UPI000487A3E1|nr:alpha/beta hydrolase [Marinobacterium jannaschii]